MKPAAIVGWTGNGSLDDLARTALGKLPGSGAGVTKEAGSLMISGEDPIVVARRLAHLPGVAWVAVGFEFDNSAGLLSRLGTLAVRYLEPGASFKVSVEAEASGREEGDVLMEATSALLKAAKGARVDERNPSVWFRLMMAKDGGACGVQLREGVGGVPTARAMKAACLVSGGYHSAVTAWMAALSGYSLTLVHARDDDESLRQVARLYAELSTRMDSSSLALEVLEGQGPAGDRVATWLGAFRGEAFTGVHPECRGMAGLRLLRPYQSALFPMLLLQEGEVRTRFDELGLRGKPTDRVARLKFSRRKASYRVKRFSGREADQNAVLDSISA